MANVDIKLGYKDLTWFNANPTLVLKVGQIVYLAQTGTYKIGDGTTQLSSLSFLGGSGSVDVNTIGAAINGATSATPNDTDLVMSVESSVAKKNTWTQIKAFLKTYFDTIYTTTSAVATQITTAISGKEDTTNKSTNVNTDQASNTKYPSVKAVYDWVTSLFVKKGTLTTNTIPKATASDTIGDSSITDNGTIVAINSNLSIDGGDMGFAANKGINSQVQMKGTNDLNWKGYYPNPLTTPTASQQASHIKLYDDGTNFFGIGLNTSATIDGVTPLSSLNIASNQTGYGVISMFTNGLRRLLIKDNGDVKIYQNLNLDNLTASQTVETDSNKNLITAAKGTAYNKDFGTSSGTITEGGTTVLKTGDSLSGALNEAKGTNIASASTTNIGAATGNYIHITGTTTITAFDTIQAGASRTLVFDGALTLTHNATSLILPGAANITTSAGDVAIFRSEGSGNWKCISYTTASDSYINFAPSFTGFSVAPTVNTGDCRYKMLSRNTCHFIFYPSALGTSNATTFTITLPFASANIGFAGQTYIVQIYNNGSVATGTMRTRLNSNICDVYTSNFGTFTASNGKSLMCSIVYQTEL